MAIYLVTKNNLKRVFQNKWTYLWMVLIPIAVTLIGSLSTRIAMNKVRVGVIAEDSQEMERVTDELRSNRFIEFQIVSEDINHTEQIMGTYQYVIDTRESESAGKVLLSLRQLEANNLGKCKDMISPMKRIMTMMMTVYMILATLYAAKLIQDKEMGMLERFRLTGFGKRNYFGGYVLSTIIIVTIQVTIAFLLLLLYSKIGKVSWCQETISILRMIASWGMVIIVASLYGVLHAFLYKREMTANIMSSSLAIILSILGGTFVSVANMPSVLQAVSWISPIRWLLAL